jgi:hypothetical protein
MKTLSTTLESAGWVQKEFSKDLLASTMKLKFLSEWGKDYHELDSPEWWVRFDFLSDINGILNSVQTWLQGKNKLITQYGFEVQFLRWKRCWKCMQKK